MKFSEIIGRNIDVGPLAPDDLQDTLFEISGNPF
jgi:hypothetical protein